MAEFWHFWTLFSLLLTSLIENVSPDGSVGELASNVSSSSQLPLSPPELLYPYNVTINHLSPRSVGVSWACRGQNMQDKYEVTLKPLEASYRVIETVPFNTCFLLMDKLEPNTNYQVSVTSISGRVRKKSTSVIFRTYMELDPEYDDLDPDYEPSSSLPSTSDPLGASGQGQSKGQDRTSKDKDKIKLPRIRLVEISLVGMALVLWAGAIVLFFHRWGKIRMLLPYQPDYKEMKRNNSVCANCSITPHHQCCRVHQLGLDGIIPLPKTDLVAVPLADAGCSPIRPRLNSFIVYDINECRKEHSPGMYRKTKSAEHLEQACASFAEQGAHEEVIDPGFCTTEF